MISIIIPIYNEEKVLLANSLRLKSLSSKAEPVYVSPRRWKNRGLLKLLFCSFMNILFFLQIPTEKIKFWYGDLR